MSTTGLRTPRIILAVMPRWPIPGWSFSLFCGVFAVGSAGVVAPYFEPIPPLIEAQATVATVPFDFTKTMRVDYFHTGGPGITETFSLDRVVNDGAWAGSRTQLVDPTNLGKYLFEVRAKSSTAVLYSRGFASIYGEWETTPEVKTTKRTFHESMRLPWPSGPVTITLRKRRPDNTFANVWSVDVDWSSSSVNQAPPPSHEP